MPIISIFNHNTDTAILSIYRSHAPIVLK